MACAGGTGQGLSHGELPPETRQTLSDEELRAAGSEKSPIGPATSFLSEKHIPPVLSSAGTAPRVTTTPSNELVWAHASLTAQAWRASSPHQGCLWSGYTAALTPTSCFHEAITVCSPKSLCCHEWDRRETEVGGKPPRPGDRHCSSDTQRPDDPPLYQPLHWGWGPHGPQGATAELIP